MGDQSILEGTTKRSSGVAPRGYAVTADGNGSTVFKYPTVVIQSTDPGAVGANVMWVDTSGLTPALRVRDGTNTSWVLAYSPPNLGDVMSVSGTPPSLPATPTVQQVADVLVFWGLATQP